jgi:hypothetical protein
LDLAIVKLVQMEELSMANTQGQSNKGQGNGSNRTGSSESSTSSQSSSRENTQHASSSPSTGGGDAFEAAISKGISTILQKLEPQLNRVATQVANRAMSRGQTFAETGVHRMQEQPWYMVAGALALVAVGVGILFAVETPGNNEPDFSRAQ